MPKDPLNGVGIDLVAAAGEDTRPPVMFRDNVVERVLGSLDAKRSVLLTGIAGAGKTAVVRAVATAMRTRPHGKLRQLSTSDVFAGTRGYVGEWQSRIRNILDAARETGTTLYFTDLLNLLTAGGTVKTDATFADALIPDMEAGRVRLLGEVTPDALQVLDRVQPFRRLFETIVIDPLTPEQVAATVRMDVGRRQLAMPDAVQQVVIELTSRFMVNRPQPGPALDLIRQVADYDKQKRGVGEPEAIDRSFIEKVFSIYTGLPRFVVSREQRVLRRELRDKLHARIIGQQSAVESVVEAITLYKASLHDPTRPIGTFLFVGPTGVGKTELARALADLLFGSGNRLLRFDLSEFKDYHSFESLIGDPEQPGRGARLLDPVRSQPFQVILFDELEKAHSNVWDLLLQLLDDGRLTSTGGEEVSFRNTFIIATSNVGSDAATKTIGFGLDSALVYEASVRHALEGEFRPEFLNRFQHIVIFHPLSRDQLRMIARQELNRILARQGIAERQLTVDIDDQALDLVIDGGYSERFGARALKRELQRRVVLPVATVLMEKEVEEGSLLRIVASDGDVMVRVIDTDESRAAWEARQPIEVALGRTVEPPSIPDLLDQAASDLDGLIGGVDVDALRSRQQELAEARLDPDFWKHSDTVTLVMRDLDICSRAIDRIERLRLRVEDARTAYARAKSRREIAQAAHRASQLVDSVGAARRELVAMGHDGFWDAIVHVRPLGNLGRALRDLLVIAYRDWATHRRMTVEWIVEPTTDDEPAALLIKGHYAHGYLELERGIHRVRSAGGSGAVAIWVAPWRDLRGSPTFVSQRALKARGQFGGKIRSRVECAEGLVLQNALTLDENRHLAAELLPSWELAPEVGEDIVRRYDLNPLYIRDALTGFTSGRTSALAPAELHELLCKRVDTAGGRSLV